MPKYVRRKEVLSVLKVHYQTLYRMEERGEIEVKRTVYNHRLYNLDKYLRENNMKKNIKNMKICYCRVSSRKQINDLYRQVRAMKKKYPAHTIIKDIGSGLNMNRKGLLQLLEYVIDGKVEELVITYKDRLTRFGYELIEWLMKTYSQGIIKILNKKEEETPQEEMLKDVLQIMNVYVAKINGMRKGKNK